MSGERCRQACMVTKMATWSQTYKFDTLVMSSQMVNTFEKVLKLTAVRN